VRNETHNEKFIGGLFDKPSQIETLPGKSKHLVAANVKVQRVGTILFFLCLAP
jgi:hypothetical protein